MNPATFTNRPWLVGALLIAIVGAACGSNSTPDTPVDPKCGLWTQWGGDSAHTGATCTTGAKINTRLADVVMDPFVALEQADSSGDIFVHYQVPLINGDDVYLEFKAGAYTPCTFAGQVETCPPDQWNSEVFTEKRLHWNGAQLVEMWRFDSDWHPEPEGGFQPMFQPALVGDKLYVPGGGGTIYKLDRLTGAVLAQLKPFGDPVDPDTYVAGPITADASGNLYYNALKLDHDHPFDNQADSAGWLVAIAPDDSVRTVLYQDMIPGAPAATDQCDVIFNTNDSPLPWPPPDDANGPARPPTAQCWSQRPGVNIAPAVGPDGTIFTVSRAGIDRYSYVVALNPDLSTKWAASMRHLLSDGCGVLIPADGTVTANRFDCRQGAALGVDLSTNDLPSGRVINDSSSSPVALPDGGVIYGSYTSYNGARGHLLKFDKDGVPGGTYDFGWDTTPSLWVHDNSYSIVLKDNHYGADTDGLPSGPYYITQLGPDLKPEWQFLSTNTKSCVYDTNGALQCVADHPHGFEWCINAPVIDSKGVVYANSEDGNIYAIAQGAHNAGQFFLTMAVGAAYTPLALDGIGRVYTLNNGKMTVLGK